MKKLLLPLLLFLVGYIELHAQDFSLNGENYFVEELRVYDESKHRLTDSELKKLSEYGFDYDAWHKLSLYRNMGLASIAVGLSFIIVPLPDNIQEYRFNFITGFAVIGGYILVRTYYESYHLIDILNDRIRVGLTPNGLGFTLNF